MPINSKDIEDLNLNIHKGYIDALVQHSKDIELLNSNASLIENLLTQFARSFSIPLPLIKHQEENEKLRNDLVFSINTPGSVISSKSDFKDPFNKNLGIPLMKGIPDTSSVLDLKTLINVVNDKMHQCGKEYHLSYHIIGHALEMMHDTCFLAKSVQLSDIWSFFAGIAGLFHDVVFTRQRIKDENESAEFMSYALTPFMEKLSVESRTIFKALIRVVIVGGTTPLFFKANSKIQMLVLAEWYHHFFPNKRNTIPELLTLCRVISDADVYRSLIPELVQTFAVLKDEPDLKTLSLIRDNLLKDKKYSSPIANTKMGAAMMYARLGQALRFSIEGTDDNLPSNSTLKKLTNFLRNGLDEFTNEEFNTKDIEFIINLLSSEISFVEIQNNSVNFTGKRSYLFITECLKWHEDLLNAIQFQLKQHNVSLQEKNLVIKDLILNAMQPQGLRVDMQKLMRQHMGVMQVGLIMPPVFTATGRSDEKKSEDTLLSVIPKPVEIEVENEDESSCFCCCFFLNRKKNSVAPKALNPKINTLVL